MHRADNLAIFLCQLSRNSVSSEPTGSPKGLSRPVGGLLVHYTVPNGRKIIDQEYGRKWSWPNSRYYSGICTEGIRKVMTNSSG